MRLASIYLYEYAYFIHFAILLAVNQDCNLQNPNLAKNVDKNLFMNRRDNMIKYHMVGIKYVKANIKLNK